LLFAVQVPIILCSSNLVLYSKRYVAREILMADIEYRGPGVTYDLCKAEYKDLMRPISIQ
jgi:hypothetical protein